MVNCDPKIIRLIKPVKAMFHIGCHMLLKEFEHVKVEVHHMDILGFNLGGDSCEIEVKSANSDLLKEMQKESKLTKHKNYKAGIGFVPTRYYFLTQKTVLKCALKFLDKHELPYGLIIYNSNTGHWTMERKSEKLSDQKFNGEINIYKGRDFKHSIF